MVEKSADGGKRPGCRIRLTIIDDRHAIDDWLITPSAGLGPTWEYFALITGRDRWRFGTGAEIALENTSNDDRQSTGCPEPFKYVSVAYERTLSTCTFRILPKTIPPPRITRHYWVSSRVFRKKLRTPRGKRHIRPDGSSSVAIRKTAIVTSPITTLYVRVDDDEFSHSFNRRN